MTKEIKSQLSDNKQWLARATNKNVNELQVLIYI